MSSARDQKLFCAVCSAFKCSFHEFVGEKVVSPSSSSAILAPPPEFYFFSIIRSFRLSIAYWKFWYIWRIIYSIYYPFDVCRVTVPFSSQQQQNKVVFPPPLVLISLARSLFHFIDLIKKPVLSFSIIFLFSVVLNYALLLIFLLQLTLFSFSFSSFLK